MTDAYRQKLLNWFCSVSVVLTFSVLSLVFDWFHHLERLVENDPSATFVELVENLGGSLFFFPFTFPIILFWHFWDFIQHNGQARRWHVLVSNYWLFAISLLTLCATIFLSASNLFTTYSCDRLGSALPFQCVIEQPDWLVPMFVINAALALLLCVVKAVISISSNLKRAL